MMNRFLVIALAAVAAASWSPSTGVVAAEDMPASTAEAAMELSAEDAANQARIAECLANGFDSEVLDCRLCHSLAASLAEQLTGAAVSETERKNSEAQRVVGACGRCCTDVEAIDGLAGKHNYARVVLEVCTCKFGRLPKIANFVHSHAAKHTRLEVKYLNARYPHLMFYDDAGEKKEEVSVASWDEDTISEFIEAKLRPQAAEEDATGAEETKDAAVDDAVEQKEEEAAMEQPREEEVVEVEVAVDGE